MARKAAKGAYAPYSGYRVGAALVAEDGAVFTGCNVENAAYGSTMCAERVALYKAVSEGRRKFVMLALAAGTDSVGVPCGACLQALAEFCDGDLTLTCATLTGGVRSQGSGASKRTASGGKTRVFTLRELLPEVFSRQSFVVTRHSKRKSNDERRVTNDDQSKGIR